MTETVFVEAFGHLYPNQEAGTIDSQEEDLYSVFRARSELMGWYAPPRTAERDGTLLWAMHEAELTYSNTHRIGYVQVGLESSISLARAIPALIQCFVDSLIRFGPIELHRIEIAAFDLKPNSASCLPDLVSMNNWFSLISGAEAVVTVGVAQSNLGQVDTRDFLSLLRKWNVGSFSFNEAKLLPEQEILKVPSEVPRNPACQGIGVGITARLPELSISAIGWAMAIVSEAIRTANPTCQQIAVKVFCPSSTRSSQELMG